MCIDRFKVNGIEVVNIKNDSEIAFLGVAMIAGSNYEDPSIAGISHYIEHMFFKGTEKRNWSQLADDFAKLGVSPNAYTNNTEVLYHMTCPLENVEPTAEILLDMLFNSTFPKEEIEKERTVILEEKKMYDDNPKYAFAQETAEKFFSWDKGHNIIGTEETISSISREDMLAYLDKRCNLGNFIVICCGKVDSEDLKRYVSDNTPTTHSYLVEGEMNKVNDDFWSEFITSNPDPLKLKVERENISQANAGMILRGLDAWDKDNEALGVLCRALGGGLYSKLFKRIREELGLCYSVGTCGYSVAYPVHSAVELYGGMSPDKIDIFMEESEKVVREVIDNGLDQNTFECAKMDMLSSLLRSVETSFGKARYYQNSSLFRKHDRTDVIESVRAVTLDD
jgi:predicted Zn-dependent peptidase